MLCHTFCHVPGLGTGTEQRLWAAGLLNWQAALEGASVPLPPARAARLRLHLSAAVERLAARDVLYFARQLPVKEHWRLFPEFRNSLAYLDIETTGLGTPGDAITTVVVYDGRTVRHFVQGRSLDDLAACLGQYDLLVTYNGKSFDIPFIRRCLGIPAEQAHIDLRHVLGGLGFRGGLKGCERQLGLDRGPLAEVDGFFAVLLWRAYQARRDERILETLLAYNALDVINLEQLLVRAYNLRLQATPFADQALPLPAPARNPFTAHPDVIAAVRRAAGWL